MDNQRPNPYAHEHAADRTPSRHNSGPEPERSGPWMSAARTMGLAVVLMVATITAVTGVFFIESTIRGEPAGAFWDDLRGASWLPMLFIGTLPALSGRRGTGCCPFRRP